MMAIHSNVVFTVFTISAINLLSGSLYFVEAHESITSALNLFLRILLKQKMRVTKISINFGDLGNIVKWVIDSCL